MIRRIDELGERGRRDPVTAFTKIGGRSMTNRFPTGQVAVMTIGAGTDHLAMVDSTGCYRTPAGWKFLMA